MTADRSAEAAAAPSGLPRVRLLSRPGCHLCDDARAVVRAVCADLAVGWDEVDITTDPALLDRYHDDIPVTLVDGRPHDFFRIDAARLRAALDGPDRSPRGRRGRLRTWWRRPAAG